VLAHGCGDTPFDLGHRAWPVVEAPPERHPAVDVWRVDHDAVTATDVLGVLDHTERARADRYRLAEHRDRFAVGRAGLRTVLARHGGTTPDAVDIVQRCRHCGGAHGPVVVRGPLQIADVYVSVAHAGRWTVVVVARGRAVGVDIEHDDTDVTGIAEVAASAPERRTLQGLRDSARRTTLHELWTRKEAYLKGLGAGLLAEPDAVDVLGGRGVDVIGASSWHLHRLAVDGAHHGALAVDGATCAARLWTLDPAWASG
jgi:4'-phosphopantetheinyl transferase